MRSAHPLPVLSTLWRAKYACIRRMVWAESCFWADRSRARATPIAVPPRPCCSRKRNPRAAALATVLGGVVLRVFVVEVRATRLSCQCVAVVFALRGAVGREEHAPESTHRCQCIVGAGICAIRSLACCIGHAVQQSIDASTGLHRLDTNSVV